MENLEGVQGVYLLCFADNPYKHAKHYLGYADNIDRRVKEHEKGNGAKLTSALVRAGGVFQVARIWSGSTREDEVRLKGMRVRKASPAMRKNQSHGRGSGVARHCPLCKERKKETKACK